MYILYWYQRARRVVYTRGGKGGARSKYRHASRCAPLTRIDPFIWVKHESRKMSYDVMRVRQAKLLANPMCRGVRIVKIGDYVNVEDAKKQLAQLIPA